MGRIPRAIADLAEITLWVFDSDERHAVLSRHTFRGHLDYLGKPSA